MKSMLSSWRNQSLSKSPCYHTAGTKREMLVLIMNSLSLMQVCGRRPHSWFPRKHTVLGEQMNGSRDEALPAKQLRRKEAAACQQKMYQQPRRADSPGGKLLGADSACLQQKPLQPLQASLRSAAPLTYSCPISARRFFALGEKRQSCKSEYGNKMIRLLAF